MSRKIILFTVTLIITTLASAIFPKTRVAEVKAGFFSRTGGEMPQERGDDRQANDAKDTIKFSQWIIMDETSTWTQEEMETVQGALLSTVIALDSVGLNSWEIFEGYRFRRWDGPYANDKLGQIAVVNHSSLEIILGDGAFQRKGGFFIYHELGHIVDRRLGRGLSESFHAGTLNTDSGPNWETADGNWFRPQGHHDREEATADAFALWVFVEYAGQELPFFNNAPENVNYESIFQTIQTALAGLKNSS